MNPDLNKLHPYPFEKLLKLKQGIIPPNDKTPIPLSIGEPRHAPPTFVSQVITDHLQDIGNYPFTKGTQELREAIAHWLVRRFDLRPESINPERHIIPVNGTREALFAFAQCMVDRRNNAKVIIPNPFYQIYEGATLLAGAQPYYLNTTKESNFVPDFASVPQEVWQQCQLVYICTPGNPTGAVMPQILLQQLIELADRYDFVIASDECYSEIYSDENNPPPGLLQAAKSMGREDYKRCIVFHSLSKRSNVPGLRSGFVAGDAEIIAKFLLYRTYHGCAMPLFSQSASVALWNDEQHVIDNRETYRKKFSAVFNILRTHLPVEMPDAGFYLWLATPIDDQDFTQGLYAQQNITVLPGSYLSRDVLRENPGINHVRIALVATIDECIEAANRISKYLQTLT